MILRLPVSNQGLPGGLSGGPPQFEIKNSFRVRFLMESQQGFVAILTLGRIIISHGTLMNLMTLHLV
jgi:hypothetical protein